jgi:hypothetical protein
VEKETPWGVIAHTITGEGLIVKVALPVLCGDLRRTEEITEGSSKLNTIWITRIRHFEGREFLHQADTWDHPRVIHGADFRLSTAGRMHLRRLMESARSSDTISLCSRTCRWATPTAGGYSFPDNMVLYGRAALYATTACS